MNSTLFDILGLVDLSHFLNATVNVRMEKEIKAPTVILSDYLEIGVLATIFPFGFVINIFVLLKLLKIYRHRTVTLHQCDLKAAFLLLKLHLTVANLLVIILYCPIKIGWLLTYRWIAGIFACKFCHFMWLLSFQISSNIIVCIALDRLRIVWQMCSASSHISSTTANCVRRVKYLLIVAWSTAIICGIPQMFVWSTIEVIPDWYQCTTIWRIKLFLHQPDHYLLSQNIYQIFHLNIVFWLPFIGIVLCYTLIVYKLASYACMPFGAATETIALNEMDKGSSTDLNAQIHLLPTGGKSDRSVSDNHPTHGVTLEVQNNKNPDIVRSPVRRVIPAWRVQMRSKMFKTTAAIVACYTFCWLPYNVLGSVVLYDVNLASQIADELNWLKSLILINSVLNPFLYGFSDE